MAIGVRRYGFHGLSYQYLMRELGRIGRPGEAGGRVLLAHLGNGASLAAVHQGRPIDTTMGMTPAGGLVMSTRSGDIDPGLVAFLDRHEQLSPQDFHRWSTTNPGCSASHRRPAICASLSAMQPTPSPPRQSNSSATRARKWIGAFAAALGGLDTLVFSGGIGEHQPQVRRSICEKLTFLGIEIDPSRNGERRSDHFARRSPVSRCASCRRMKNRQSFEHH